MLSWSSDGTLRLWTASGEAAGEPLTGHVDEVTWAMQFRDGRILSWSRLDSDRTLRLWAGPNFSESKPLVGHASGIAGALELLDGRILSWDWGHTLRLWSRSGSISDAIPLDAEFLALAGAAQDLRIIARRSNRVLIYDLALPEPDMPSGQRSDQSDLLPSDLTLIRRSIRSCNNIGLPQFI